MHFAPNEVYHIYNRGNNKQKLFFNEENYLFFLRKINNQLKPICDILCWCLMPNHFHFLIHTDARVSELKKQGGLFLDPVTNGFRKTLSAYSHQFNLQNDRSGALFRPKTKSKCITDEVSITRPGLSSSDHFAKCFHYIHNNPVAAGLVSLPEQWVWSSYKDYIGENEDSFCNRELAYKLLGTERIT